MTSTRLNIYFALMIIGTTAAASVLTVELYARIYFARSQAADKRPLGLLRYDPKLGWDFNDGTYRQEHPDFTAAYTVAAGLRKTICPEASGDSLDLYGDSFAFGTGVNDDETIAAYLCADLHSGINNYGTPGYGPDQYWLKSEQHPAQGRLRIFVILTGNDYKDINSDMDEGRQRFKPFLRNSGAVFDWAFPEPAPESAQNHQEAPAFFKAPALLRQLAKASPQIVRWRSRFVSANPPYVSEALDRIRYLYNSADPLRTLFVIMPSISLRLGISTNTDEGLFAARLEEYFKAHNFFFVNLNADNSLDPADYWPNEGHLKPQGNKKAAAQIAAWLKSHDLPVQQPVLRPVRTH